MTSDGQSAGIISNVNAMDGTIRRCYNAGTINGTGVCGGIVNMETHDVGADGKCKVCKK